MGKKNQLYAKFIRLFKSTDNPNEIILILEKDKPMEEKYIRQFEDMFQGKDVIITFTKLIRNKREKENPFWSIGEE